MWVLWAPSVALLNVVMEAGAQAFLHSVKLIDGSSLLGLLMHQVLSKGQGKEMTTGSDAENIRLL